MQDALIVTSSAVYYNYYVYNNTHGCHALPSLKKLYYYLLEEIFKEVFKIDRQNSL